MPSIDATFRQRENRIRNELHKKVSVHLKITVQYTIDELKMAITQYIRNVDRAVLNTVFENTVRRVNKCLQTGGGHFEHYL